MVLGHSCGILRLDRNTFVMVAVAAATEEGDDCQDGTREDDDDEDSRPC